MNIRRGYWTAERQRSKSDYFTPTVRRKLEAALGERLADEEWAFMSKWPPLGDGRCIRYAVSIPALVQYIRSVRAVRNKYRSLGEQG